MEERLWRASSQIAHTLASLPSVKRQVLCVGDRLEMVKHKAWATTIVAKCYNCVAREVEQT